MLSSSDKGVLVSEVRCPADGEGHDRCRNADGQAADSETALRDRAHADRWDSGSSQGSRRGRGGHEVQRGTDGERSERVAGEIVVKLNKRK